MRKRKYSQLDASSHYTDMLLEDVDDFYNTSTVGPTRPDTISTHIQSCGHCYDQDRFWGDGLANSGQYDPKHIRSYVKQKFAAIMICLQNLCCIALLFTSGKMVLTGCRSYVECIDCTLQVVRMMREYMRSTNSTLCIEKVQNMVGNVVLNFNNNYELLLDDMNRENNIYCTYQKKMFPGLIYRPDNSPSLLLLFQIGKIVVTGSKSVYDMQQGWVQLWPFVLKYIRPVTSICHDKSRWPALVLRHHLS